jgi:YbgC/YbaW family acyl-CoA thioester hydrolase
MEGNVYHLPIQIYYEDTDFSGVVYHANYLKFFERAREHVIGTANLVKLWEEGQMGFAVYKADITYSEGVTFGETLDVRSEYRFEGEYRIIWRHEAWRQNATKAAVTCDLHLVCTDRSKKLKPIPKGFLSDL